MKIAVVSNLLPPSFSGQPVMLYRLLKDVAAEQYCLISTANPEATDKQSFSRRLPGKYFQISGRSELTRGYRYKLPILRWWYNVTVAAYARARQVARIVRAEHCEAVLSCSSGADLLDVPAGFIASRLARVPFYVYLFDTYSHVWVEPNTQFIGRRLERFILKRAAGIVSTNEMVRDLLRETYGVDSVVIHNPCDLSAYQNLTLEPDNTPDSDVKVVYTGAIYDAQIGALRTLLKSIEMLNRPEIKLHLYTPVSSTELAARGILGPMVHHGHQPAAAMPGIQRRADVLFFPLSFDSVYDELIKISSPGKVGEYLASGRPVLVHAPPDSFISTYFRKHDCGLVVDQDDPKMLAQALENLLDDEELQQRLVKHAWQRAINDFSLEESRDRFVALLGLCLATETSAGRAA